MNLEIREMTIDDYDAARQLWERTENLGFSQSDSAEGVEKYLARNPGLSFVAEVDGTLVGTVMCGHDGRRGYINHLAVASKCRRAGIGKALVERCTNELKVQGIIGCNLFIWDENKAGIRFWEELGWREPDDWGVMWQRLEN